LQSQFSKGKTFIRHFRSEESVAIVAMLTAFSKLFVRRLFVSPFLPLMKVSEMYFAAKRSLLFWIKWRAMTRDTRERSNYFPRCLITERLRNREPIIDTLFSLESCIQARNEIMKKKKVKSFNFAILIHPKCFSHHPWINILYRILFPILSCITDRRKWASFKLGW